MSVVAAMNRTSAELSRGFSTTAPETTADAGTAPADLAPAGTLGAASICSVTGGRGRPTDADAGEAPAADKTSNPSKAAIRGTTAMTTFLPRTRYQRGPIEPSLQQQGRALHGQTRIYHP